MAIDGFEDGLPPLMAAYRHLRAARVSEPVVLSDRMERYWKSLQGSYEDAIPYWVRLGRAAAEKKRPNPYLQHLSIALARLGADLRRPHRLPIYLRDAVRSALAPTPVAGHHDGRFYRAEEAPRAVMRAAARFGRNHGHKVRRHYDELAVDADLDQPYVYVALHAQPERATNPRVVCSTIRM